MGSPFPEVYLRTGHLLLWATCSEGHSSAAGPNPMAPSWGGTSPGSAGGVAWEPSIHGQR